MSYCSGQTYSSITSSQCGVSFGSAWSHCSRKSAAFLRYDQSACCCGSASSERNRNAAYSGKSWYVGRYKGWNLDAF